ncbi:reverse transcriptase domain-containing protein [Tanacetum coccineum]
MSPIHEYLLSGLLPKDPRESRKIRIKALQYKLIKGSLYKKSFFTPCLRCITPLQVDNIIKEIHEGSCGFNAEPRSMVVKIIKQGYYWPSMHRDAAKIIHDCAQCKEQSMAKKIAGKDVIAVVSVWGFSHWGVNILGPLPTTSGGLKFLAIVVEHSTNGSESIIPIAESIISKDNRDTTKENAKRKESKEVASIEEAYYQNKLRRYHDVRSNRSTYKLGDFVLLLLSDTKSPHTWKGPYMIKETTTRGDIGLEAGAEARVAF